MTLDYDCYCEIAKHLTDNDYINFCKVFGIKISQRNLTKYFIIDNIMLLYGLDVDLNNVLNSLDLDFSDSRYFEKHIKGLKKYILEFQDDECTAITLQLIYDSPKQVSKRRTRSHIWFYISLNQELSEQFIRQFKNRVNWYGISCRQKLSEQFIKEFQENVNWSAISKYQDLSEEFIAEYQDRLNWNSISLYQKLSNGFIERFKSKINWSEIIRNQRLSQEVIYKLRKQKSSTLSTVLLIGVIIATVLCSLVILAIA